MLLSTALSFCAAHYGWLLVCALLLLLLVQLARHASADADFDLLAAARAYPQRGAFAGQVVLIVGASSGIGEALALEFARGGATVIVAARRMEELQRVAKQCLAEGAAASQAVALDVTAFGSHEGVVAELLRKHGRIDILCNNAGRSQRGLVEVTPLAVDQELFALNVFGVMSMTRAVLRHALGKQERLRILNTSSVAGKVGSAVSASYAASKHAIQGWMDSLRMELGWRGWVYFSTLPLLALTPSHPLPPPPPLPRPTATRARRVSVTNCCPGPVHSEITLHSFTDVPGKEMGVREDGSTRMSAARCALLMAAACHAGLEEAWMAPQPILFFVYVGQYVKWLYFRLSPTLGKQRVQGWKSGVKGYNSLSVTAALSAGSSSSKSE